jgi:hypothetical protein
MKSVAPFCHFIDHPLQAFLLLMAQYFRMAGGSIPPTHKRDLAHLRIAFLSSVKAQQFHSLPMVPVTIAEHNDRFYTRASLCDGCYSGHDGFCLRTEERHHDCAAVGFAHGTADGTDNALACQVCFKSTCRDIDRVLGVEILHSQRASSEQ